MALDFQGSQLTASERVQEAQRCVQIIEQNGQADSFSEKELNFIDTMKTADWVSPKQLAWLRELKDKVL